MNDLNVGIDDLVIAYRKAKSDLFYSSRNRQMELADFEQKLEENLKSILSDLEEGKAPSFDEDSWTVVPKKEALKTI